MRVVTRAPDRPGTATAAIVEPGRWNAVPGKDSL